MADRFDASQELTRIIEDSIGPERIFATRVTHYRDHADEPAFSIAVIVNAAKDLPDAQAQSELTHRLRGALAEHDDARFPYLYFRAHDDMPDPDDVDEFEALPDPSEQD